MLTRVSLTLISLLSSMGAFAQTPTGSCSLDITRSVALGLDHALEDARDLPDYGFLTDGRETIYVSSYLWENDCVVDDSVLPETSDQNFVLMSQQDLTELAARRRSDIVHVDAGDVRILGGEIRLWVRVAIQPYADSGLGLECCCGGEMVFRRNDVGWEFAEWAVTVCA